MNRSLRNAVVAAKAIAITGHKHPDGDCVGSCMAMYYYLKDNFADKTVRVYLETPPENLAVLPAWDEIDTEFLPPEKPYDLFLVLDCSSEDRFPCAKDMVAAAKHTFVVDHHIHILCFRHHSYRTRILRTRRSFFPMQAPPVRCCSAFSRKMR